MNKHMNKAKEKLKAKVKKHLWGWDYSVRDIEGLIDGMDLLVNNKYKVKVLTSKENINNELTTLKDNQGDDSMHDSIAVVGKKMLYAGGSQKEPILTTKHKEVFK